MLSEVEKQKAEIARQEATLSMYDLEIEREVESPKFGSAHKVLLPLGIVMILLGVGVYAAYYFQVLTMLTQTLAIVAAGAVAGVGVLISIIGIAVALKTKKAKRI